MFLILGMAAGPVLREIAIFWVDRELPLAHLRVDSALRTDLSWAQNMVRLLTTEPPSKIEGPELRNGVTVFRVTPLAARSELFTATIAITNTTTGATFTGNVQVSRYTPLALAAEIANLETVLRNMEALLGVQYIQDIHVIVRTAPWTYEIREKGAQDILPTLDFRIMFPLEITVFSGVKEIQDQYLDGEGSKQFTILSADDSTERVLVDWFSGIVNREGRRNVVFYSTRKSALPKKRTPDDSLLSPGGRYLIGLEAKTA